jgi:hypothetical protein
VIDPETEAFEARLEACLAEHAALDREILVTNPLDTFTLQRLKRRKLMLKDEIAWLRDQLEPDIIA